MTGLDRSYLKNPFDLNLFICFLYIFVYIIFFT